MKRVLLAFLLIFSAYSVNAAGPFAQGSGTTLVLMNAATAIGAGTIISPPMPNQTYQATETCTGTCSATVLIQGSDDGVGWVTLGTITLSGTSPPSDGFASIAPWIEVRGNITAISGTSAAVTVTMGAQ